MLPLSADVKIDKTISSFCLCRPPLVSIATWPMFRFTVLALYSSEKILNQSQPVFIKLLLRLLSRLWRRSVLGCCTRNCTDRSFKHCEHSDGQYPSSPRHCINIGCLGFEMLRNFTQNVLCTEQLLRPVVITWLLYVFLIIFAVFLHKFLAIVNVIHRLLFRLYRDFQYCYIICLPFSFNVCKFPCKS